MLKKNMILAVAFTLALILGNVSLAETPIVDSMEFQGNAEAFTLNEVIDTVLNDNPSIKKCELDKEQAKLDSEKMRSAARKARSVYGSSSLEYKQFVLLPEMTAKFLNENANRTYNATVEGVKADIEKCYYQLLQAEQLLEINRENMQVALDLFEKTKKKHELGLIAKQEVLNSELNYISALNEFKSAENTLKTAKMALNIKLGHDVMSEIKLDGELEYNEYKPIGIAQAVSSAFEKRMEIKSAEFTYESERINAEYYSKMYSDISFNYREHKIKMEKAAKDLIDIRKTIEMEVRSNYLDIIQKQKEIVSGEKSVLLAEEALKIAQVSYDAGMGLMTDVQKAQVALQQAKLGLSRAILDYNLAVLRFEDSMGVGRIEVSGI